VSDATDGDVLGKLPKVELHLHLEGAIPLDCLWELVKKYGGASEVGDRSGLESRFQFQDFPHFIETWIWKNGFLREYDDFTFFADRIAGDLARQRIRYVEAFFTPGDFTLHGLASQRIAEALRRGLDRHAREVTVRLIADLNRDLGPDKGARWLEEMAEVKELGIIGIGLGGSEQRFPPEPYREVYQRARRLGFHTTAHAGEAAGAASIWGAIEALGVERIGHGTRAIEDSKLVDYLKEKQVPLEVCPISNVKTGVVSDLKAHPVLEYYRQGLLVTINSDDPKMFGNGLEMEYRELMEAFGFGLEDIKKLIANGVRAAWCDKATKDRLLEELGADSP
jgi:adenosine deaminase